MTPRRSHRRRPIRLAFVACLLLAAPAARAGDADDGAARLRQRVNGWLAPYVERHDFSGVILVARDAEVVLREAYGLASRELAVPMHAGHVFAVASLSKQMAALAILRLAEQGRLDLDDALAKWLPDFPGADAITIRMLLSHRAGIPHSAFRDHAELMTDVPSPQLVARIGAMPRLAAPGEQRRYSTAGYAVLARVIEIVTGSSFDGAMRELVFEPAGMTRSGDLATGAGLVPGRVPGYEAAAGATEAPARAIGWMNKLGGGSLYTCADDLYRLHVAIARERLVPGASYRELVANNWGGARMYLGDESNRFYGCNGHIDGYSAVFDRQPDPELGPGWCVIVLSNVRSGLMEHLRDLIWAELLGIEYEPDAPRPDFVAAPGRDELDRCAGAYAFRPDQPASVRRRDGSLEISFDGFSYFPLDPVGPHRFFMRRRYAFVEFRLDADDAPASTLVWEEQGTDEWPRID